MIKELIISRVDPDELVDILELTTAELYDILEYKILEDESKFDYLKGSEDEEDFE